MTAIQRDLFLSEPIAFPGAGPKVSVTKQATPFVPFLSVGDKIKSISEPYGGKRYAEGTVIEVMSGGRYVKVTARRLYSPYHRCMFDIWVKASDCVPKRKRG